ncbi:MAG TPA: lytic murein transglycosylase [Nocardioidaceae bacterium]|nr:lytic murein transglycosylase [Nocardioidaceae bacterium]
MILAPVAAALVVVLASTGGSSPVTPDPAGADVGTEVLATQASVTEVGTGTGTGTGGTLRPAVRVAATSGTAGTAAASVSANKVAGVLLRAYRSAAGSVPTSCHLQVSLLAAIGEVESGSLAGRPLDSRHRTSVLGPVLDGNGFASIPDTDKGRWDGDATWDRAMGPMQFVPSTWRSFGVDGDADGVAHPQDVEDAAASAAAYLCYGGRDLAQPDELRSAIWSYNHSTAYEKLVMTYQKRYAALGLDSGVTATLLPTVSAAVSATPVGGLGSGLASVAALQPSADTAGPRKAASDRAPKGATGRPAPAGAPTPAAPGTPSRAPATDRGPARAPATGTPSPARGPSGSPSLTPGNTPTATPSGTPSKSPSATPTKTPSATPSKTPSATPS